MRKHRKLILFLKAAAWTAMACVLAVAALTLCFLRLVSSETLTLITNDAANRLLDAQVTVGKVALSSRNGTPVLNVDIDSVVVLSGPMLRLDDEARSQVPQWGDTLFTLSHFRGGINLLALMRRKIDLYDVEFDEPAINLVALDDSITNYNIYNAREYADTATSAVKMPAIAINRFSIKCPKPVRFHNALTGNHFNLNLSAVDIVGGDKPGYSLQMGGDMASPSLALYNTDRLNFGIDGHMGWKPESPTELELKNFSLRANFINALVNAHVDFGREIVVNDYSLQLQETSVEDLLHLLPDSLRTRFGLEPERIVCESDISAILVSNAPFNLNTDSVPDADLTITVSPGRLKYDRVDLRQFGGRITALMRGNDLDRSELRLEDIVVEGNALKLDASMTLRDIASDPSLEGSIRGDAVLQRLPGAITRRLGGYLGGRVKADFNFRGRQSMLNHNNFHRLHVDGDIDLTGIYYLSADTADMLTLGKASLRFGDRLHSTGDTLLTASVKIDSAAFLHTQYSVKLRDLSLGLGAHKDLRQASGDNVLPIGGDLRMGRLGLTVLGDSVLVDISNGHGHLEIKRFKNRPKQPLISLGLDMGHLSAGTPDTRFLLSDGRLNVDALKLLDPATDRRTIRKADSIRRANPTMPIDSVYARARYLATHKKKGKYPRVHADITADSTEIIAWGTSDFLRTLLTKWRLKGNVAARRGSLYTPLFPLRNRMRNFNLSFTNDTILLENVKYKLGASDFLLSGRVSNLARSLTSKNYSSTLKLNFELKSDTVDINQLAGATFRGSAYAATRRTSDSRGQLDMYSLIDREDLDDDRLEEDLGRMVENAPDGRAPLLVPKNIDARITLSAANVLYSDIGFRDVTGEVMMARGALNLHGIKATSDAGAMSLSALYSSPSIDDLSFGFGLDVDRFNIERFIRLVPALDSVMPMLSDFSGIVDARVAATCKIDREMNLVLPSLDAAVRINGDSLAFINPDTYRKIGKWLRFKDKESNIVKHMNVELTVSDDLLQIYPFIFDLDRYRLGVEGYNDLDMNFNYHIAVLKSPLPFRFGVTVSGTPHKYKVRFGKARLNENQAARSSSLVDTARVNLLSQIENVFRRGVDNSRFARLNISSAPTAAAIDLNADTLTRADSIAFVREGLIPASELSPSSDSIAPGDKADKKQSKQSSLKAILSRKRKTQ